MTRRIHKRLAAELAQLQKIEPCGIAVRVSQSSIMTWRAYIEGPSDTPFEGITFEVEVTLPSNYPFSPPRLMFKSGCWHANIGVNGHVCMDTLASQWAPGLSVFHVLLSVQSLLNDPVPSDPLNHEAGLMWNQALRTNNFDEFRSAVRKHYRAKGVCPEVSMNCVVQVLEE